MLIKSIKPWNSYFSSSNQFTNKSNVIKTSNPEKEIISMEFVASKIVKCFSLFLLLKKMNPGNDNNNLSALRKC